MFNRIFLFGLLSFLMLSGCEQKYLENTKEIAAEVEQHKIKRITTPMIGKEAQRVGDSLVILAFKALRPGQDQAPESCNLQENEAVANLTEAYMAKAGYVLATNKPAYQQFLTDLDTWKKGLAVQNPEVSDAQVYITSDSVYYAMPIAPEVAGAITCFKTDPATKQSPATAGYWFVRFDRKGLIQAITRKVKKGRWGRKK